MKAKDKNGRFGTEQSPHPPLPPPAPPTATSPTTATISKWSNSPTNALPKVALVQEGGDSTLQNLTMIQFHRQLWKQRGSSKSRLQILHRQHTFQVTIKPNLIRFNVQDYFLHFSQKQAWISPYGVHIVFLQYFGLLWSFPVDILLTRVFNREIWWKLEILPIPK